MQSRAIAPFQQAASMQIVRSSAITFSTADVVYRQTWRTPAIMCVVLLGSTAAMAIWAVRFHGPWVLALFSGSIMTLMAWLAGLSVRRARQPSNWLLAVDGRRIRIKLRSYLNVGLGAPDVLELRMDELASVRSAVVRTRAGRVEYNATSESLELQLTSDVDLVPVEEWLRADSARPAKSGIVFRDQPMTLMPGNVLRLEWQSPSSRIAPGLDHVVALLGRQIAVLPGTHETFDFSQVGKTLSRADAEAHLKRMAAKGHRLKAREIGRRMLGWSVAEADRFDDSLRTLRPQR